MAEGGEHEFYHGYDPNAMQQHGGVGYGAQSGYYQQQEPDHRQQGWMMDQGPAQGYEIPPYSGYGEQQTGYSQGKLNLYIILFS